jgi:hypothetical protein
MNQYSSSDSPVSSSVDADPVSRRAYELWENEGRPEGCDLRHWLQAEQELGVHHSDNEVQNETAESVPTTATSSTSSEARPLQGTQSGAVNRENRRGSSNPFSTRKTSPADGNAQSAGRRKSASAPPL